MKLEEYCDALNVQIKITFYPTQGGRWSADLAGCEIKNGSLLESSAIDGHDPEDAMFKLCCNLRGKRIVFHAGDKESRREYIVPKGLGVD